MTTYSHIHTPRFSLWRTLFNLIAANGTTAPRRRTSDRLPQKRDLPAHIKRDIGLLDGWPD